MQKIKMGIYNSILGLIVVFLVVLSIPVTLQGHTDNQRAIPDRITKVEDSFLEDVTSILTMVAIILGGSVYVQREIRLGSDKLLQKLDTIKDDIEAIRVNEEQREKILREEMNKMKLEAANHKYVVNELIDHLEIVQEQLNTLNCRNQKQSSVMSSKNFFATIRNRLKP